MSAPDDPTETFEQSDEAIDDASALDPDFIEEIELDPSLDPSFQGDDKELEEIGAQLDDPEQMAVLDGLIDDPDGLGGPSAQGRTRETDADGWDLDAPIVRSDDDDDDGERRRLTGCRPSLSFRYGSPRSGCRCRSRACTGCSGCTARRGGRPCAHRSTRSGSRSSARAMATKAKPSPMASSTVSSRLTPPSRMTRQVEDGQELAGLGTEVALLERVLLQEPSAHHAESEPQRLGQGGGELGPRGVPPEQVHGIGQRTATGQLEGVEVTVLLEHAGEGDALGNVEAAGHPVGHVEFGGDGHRVAGTLAHGRHHLAGEPGPVPRATHRIRRSACSAAG